MSQAVEVIERILLPDLELPEEDGEPLESEWHRAQINLLIDVVKYRWRDRQDFYAGGNMFIYYSTEQARRREYKGPDFFVVKGVDGRYLRRKWVVWEEKGRFPNVIVELLSPSTAAQDLGKKKDLYEQTFHTADYFCYNPDTEQLLGWRLVGDEYVALEADDQERLWSSALDGWLGTWEGEYLEEPAVWLRLFDADGNLLPTKAEAAQQRAEVAEAEIARLRTELDRRPRHT